MNLLPGNVVTAGPDLQQSDKALVLIHGRGATAQSILSLANHLAIPEFSLFAPQALNNSWYPYSFMAPVLENKPALDLALSLLNETVTYILTSGVKAENIYLLGFSQGACLTSEYATRHACRYGGLILFTGGLIGDKIDKSNYSGNYNNTPVLLTTGDPDPHVPVTRVHETRNILIEMGAKVTLKIYPGRTHTILPEEIELARKLLNGE